jgi:murein L,D-transpeptidase YcbB/YkuD
MYLLADQAQWTSQAVDSAISGRIEKFVPLNKPVPVYVVYFTAFVDTDGVLNFSKDVYGRDLQLKRMILNQAAPPLPLPFSHALPITIIN